MEFEIITAGQADLPDVLTPVLTAFGETRWGDEDWEDEAIQFADYRLLAAKSDDGWVGNVADFPFELTLPGGGVADVAGVTMVGVLPTHRRQGITSALMARLLDDAAARGEAVAVLLASESSIYGRFGFGVATQFHGVHIETAASAFAIDPPDDGHLRLVPDPAEAVRLAEEVWERHRGWRPGTLSRRPWTWELMRRDREKRRDGLSPYFWVVHTDADGTPDGYAAYRLKQSEDHGRPRSVAKVRDLVAVDADVEAMLFRYLCDIDLIHRLEIQVRPVDDPIRWRLRDSRQLVIDEQTDFLWARIIDVAAAMSARRYACDDRLVVDVADAFRPDSGGRFLIEGGPEHATCQRTDEPVDLALDASALASLLLGTLPTSVLVAAGRIHARPDVVRRADAFFASSPPPFSCTQF